VQATGHGASSPADNALFISTRRLDGVSIDPQARTATFQAGVRWERVIEAAGEHGLAPLSGSAPFVGATSYTLGGGLGLISRAHGLASDSVVAFDLVTADGRLHQVTADSDPDLFWGVRGSKGNLGVVTSLTVRLFSVPMLYGGSLFVDGAHLREALGAWLDWTARIDEFTATSFFMVQFPTDDALPSELNGRYVLTIRLAYAGPDLSLGRRSFAELSEALPPLLTGGLAELPYAQAGSIHNDPPAPVPTQSRTIRLANPDGDLLDLLVWLAGPGTDVDFGVEVRLLGGALDRPSPVPGAVRPPIGAALNVYIASLVPDPAQAPAIAAGHQAFLDALAPWAVPGAEINFLAGVNTGHDLTRAAYLPEDYERLRRLKAEWDPGNTFRYNPNIPPAMD
jgi:FAD/FMN-containing dehydrogenase